jgi:hypothetical protein
MNDELVRIWKENDRSLIDVLSQHLPGGNAGNHKNLSQDIQCHSRNLNRPPLKYKPKSATTVPTQLVRSFKLSEKNTPKTRVKTRSLFLFISVSP